MSTPLETQNRRRAGYKSVITKDIRQVDDVIASGDSSRIATLRDNLTTYLAKVHQLDESILNLTPADEQDQAMIDQSDYTLRVSVVIHKLNAALVVPPIIGVPSVPALPVPASIKLPKLDIRQYEGDVTEWNSFWELYSVSVHDRNDIQPIQKFSYLKNLLRRSIGTDIMI